MPKVDQGELSDEESGVVLLHKEVLGPAVAVHDVEWLQRPADLLSLGGYEVQVVSERLRGQLTARKQEGVPEGDEVFQVHPWMFGGHGVETQASDGGRLGGKWTREHVDVLFVGVDAVLFENVIVHNKYEFFRWII